MAQNPRCCCGPCTVRDGCGGIAFSETEGHCCKCIPIRACVSLFTDNNICNDLDWEDGYTATESVEAQWIDADGCSRQYAGLFACGGDPIDFSVRFYRDEYDQCFWALESVALGHYHPDTAGSGGVDSRLMESMGDTIAERRTNCRNMSVSFDVVFNDSYETTGRITVEPADYKPRLQKKTCNNCKCDRACIRVFDGYTESTTVTCINDYEATWTIEVDGDPQKRVSVHLDDNEYGISTLSLESYLGDGDPVQASCDPMSARWEFYDGSFVVIAGDAQAKCTDCSCHCRCLCVTWSSFDGFGRTTACFDEGYEGCSETFIPEDISEMGGYDISFEMLCVGCENKQTKLSILLPDGLTLIGSQEQTIGCPDTVSATWGVLLEDGETTATIEVICKTCGTDCTVEELTIVSPCCPDRRMPLTLYATIEAISGCPELAVGTTIALGQEGIAGALEDCWSGAFDEPCHFGVRCHNSPPTVGFFANNAGTPCVQGGTPNPMTLVSCDPFEAVVTITGWGCCDVGPNAVITVRVTE